MAKHTLKIMLRSHRNILKVCLAIFQHHAWKGQNNIEIQPPISCSKLTTETLEQDVKYVQS